MPTINPKSILFVNANINALHIPKYNPSIQPKPSWFAFSLFSLLCGNPPTNSILPSPLIPSTLARKRKMNNLIRIRRPQEQMFCKV